MLRNFLLTATVGALGFVSQIKAAEREIVKHEGRLYHVFRVPKTGAGGLDLLWLGKDGNPLGNFDGLRARLMAEKKRIVFATNAGIYARGPKPCGLTISAHKELVPLNLNPGDGNFFLKPNGVFYLDDHEGAGVMEAAEFGTSGLRPRIATQSGPLLLRHGVMHPAFRKGSPNLRQRSGVGVRADGEIVFVNTDREASPEGRVTFHELATFFLHLRCKDALYLDGDISDMLVNPQPKMVFPANTFAAMFVIAR